MKLRFFILLLLLETLAFGQTRFRHTVLLYPDGQTGNAAVVNGLSGAEDMRPHGYLRNVSDSARFDIYLPEHDSGIMVVVCPGGGYGEISTINEGELAAAWFNRHGIAAAVLTYRLPNGHDTVPLEDVHRTFRYCRAHAAEMGVHSIGVFGASAGGHLAATAATYFTDAQTRPDFCILFYPVITMEDALTDPGTRRRLIGENPTAEMVDRYSLQLHVTDNTPATYIIVSSDDSIVPPSNSFVYADSLASNGVPLELHVLPDGGHGWGFSKGSPELEVSLAPWVLRHRSTLGLSKEMIKSDMRRAGNIMHSYEAPTDDDIPAPEGFVPFYISHIGRHGSRYNTNLDSFDRYLAQLDSYKRKWGLTKDGKMLLSALEDIYEANVGNLGQLTELGREEHRGLSKRMQQRFPEVFSDSERRVITASSTGVQRVKDSKEAFLSQIEGFDVLYSPDPYSSRNVNSGADKTQLYRELENRRYKRALTDDLTDMSRLVSKTFRKPEDRYDKNDLYRLFAGLFSLAVTRQCIGYESGVLDSYFTPEEAYTFWYESNTNVFQSFCISAENEGEKARSRAVPIIQDMLEKADAAIAGNDVAADLRFSHDTFVQPLLSLLGAEGNTYSGTAGWANSHFCAFTSVPMAVNVQFVFYRNKDNDVIVKILHNEREVVIPSLNRLGGVYHAWDEFKAYVQTRLTR